MKLTKKQLIIMIIILISFFILLISIYFVKKENNIKSVDDIKIYYRVFDGNKWGKWKKNGKTAGTLGKSYIKNIQFKIKSKKYDSDITFRLYNNEWSDDYTIDDNIKSSNIKAIEMSAYKNLAKNYIICYRTYNTKDKWLGWACNDQISGNSKYNVSALQVKFIPKKSVFSEYLVDYDFNDVSSKNFD